MNINRRSLLDKVEILLRIWIAYILVTNSGVGFITPLEKLGLPPHIFQILDGMWKTGFMMHMVKAVELTSGLMILFNFYVPVALLALIPWLLISMVFISFFFIVSLPMASLCFSFADF
jgi:hypothetical protein